MPIEIPFSLLPKRVQESLEAGRELSTVKNGIKDGIKTDCIEILSKRGELIENKKTLPPYLFSDSLNLTPSEKTSWWTATIPLNIKGEEKPLYISIKALGSDLPNKSTTTFILRNDELFPSIEPLALVLSPDKIFIGDVNYLKFKRDPTIEDIEQLAQLITLANKEDFSKQEESCSTKKM